MNKLVEICSSLTDEYFQFTTIYWPFLKCYFNHKIQDKSEKYIL